MSEGKIITVLDLSGRISEKRKAIFTKENLFKSGVSLQWLDSSPELLEPLQQEPLSILKSGQFAKIDGVLLPRTISDSLLQAPVLPEDVKESGNVDAMIKQDGKRWLRCFYQQALRQVIIDKHPKLSTHQIAFLTDDGPLVHLCASLLIQMGYKKIILLTEDPLAAEEKVKVTTSKYFGTHITFLEFDKLTEQPSQGSVLINLLNPQDKPELYGDLLYLNFLKKDSLVIDLGTQDIQSGLTEESIVAGVHGFTALPVLARRDYLFLQQLSKNQIVLSPTEFQLLYSE